MSKEKKIREILLSIHRLVEISQSENTRSIDGSAKQPPKGTINSNTLVDTIKPTKKDIKTLENTRLLVNFDTKSGELLFSKDFIFL